MKRLAIINTHPIQYFVPIWQALATGPDVDIQVFYASDHSVKGSVDGGFGVYVKWDGPMLAGYPSTLLTERSFLEQYSSFFQHDRKDVNYLFRKEKFDALLVTAYRSMLHIRAIMAANRAMVPIIYRAEDMDCTNPRRNFAKEIIRHRILKRLYRRISAFASIGHSTKRHYLRHGVNEERIFSSPYCVNDDLFNEQRARFGPARDEIRESLGFSKDDFVFMFSGKMISKKNPLLIAEAMSLLPQLTNVGFLGVGDGDLRNEFKEGMAQKIGNRSVFLGFVNQSELGKYYVASDALILPSSHAETWGLVVNEAQIYGLPVIVSDTVGCREDLVIPTETGYIFASGNSADLALCMWKLIKDKNGSRRMGQRGRELSELYTVKAAAKGILEALAYATAPN